MDRRAVASVAITAALAVACVLYSRKKPETEDGMQPPVKPNGEPFEAGEVAEIFRELCERLQAHMAQVMKQLAPYLQQGVSQEQLMPTIIKAFETNGQTFQGEIFKKRGVEEEDVEYATDFYLKQGNASVKAAVEELKGLYQGVGGQVETDVPEDVTVDKVCAALDEFMDVMADQQMEMIGKIHAEGRQAPTEAEQLKLQADIKRLTTEVLDKHGLTQPIFQAAMKKFESDPKFQKMANDKQQAMAKKQQQFMAMSGMG